MNNDGTHSLRMHTEPLGTSSADGDGSIRIWQARAEEAERAKQAAEARAMANSAVSRAAPAPPVAQAPVTRASSTAAPKAAPKAAPAAAPRRTAKTRLGAAEAEAIVSDRIKDYYYPPQLDGVPAQARPPPAPMPQAEERPGPEPEPEPHDQVVEWEAEAHQRYRDYYYPPQLEVVVYHRGERNQALEPEYDYDYYP